MRATGWNEAGRESTASPLGRFLIFDGASGADLSGLNARAEEYDRGDTIWRGEKEIVAVAQGRACVYSSNREGTDSVLKVLYVGDLFGLAALYGSAPVDATVRGAERHTQVFHIPQIAFRNLLAARPNIAAGVIAALGRDYLALCDRYEDALVCVRRVRVAHEVARDASRHGRGWVDATQEELAARVGSRAPEIARDIKRLREEGLVVSTPYSPGIYVPDTTSLLRYGKET